MTLLRLNDARWSSPPVASERAGRAANAGSGGHEPLVLALAGGALWLSSAHTLPPRAIGDYGLAFALPPQFYVGLLAVVAAFGWTLAKPRLRTSAVVVELGVLVLMLHGVTAVVEPLPRFSTAWFHSGFTEYIMRTGHTLPQFDARFSWPGFFSMAALMTGLAGAHDAVAFLRWTPTLVNGLVLLPIYVIARTATVDRRCCFLAVWLFALLNWIGQDYFAPQAVGFFLFLVIIAVLLRYFRSDRRGPLVARLLARRARPGGEARVPGGSVLPLPPQRTATALVALVCLMTVSLVVTHQLTPLFLLIGAGALVATGRLRLRMYPLFVAVLTVAWVSFGAVTYWKGHLHDVIGGIGQVGSSVTASTVERVGPNPAHHIVLGVRLGLSAATVALAGIGLFRRLRAGKSCWSVVWLALTPFVALAVQTYGGEVLLRAQLFALPFLAVLAAFAFYPSTPRRPLACAALAVAFSLVAIPAFLVARYGNERFEYMPPGEKRAVDFVYATAPPGSTLVALRPTLPWRYKWLERFRYGDSGSRSAQPDLDSLHRVLADAPTQAFLILSRTQEAWGELNDGLPPGWIGRLRQTLVESPQYTLVYTNPDASIFVLNTRPRVSGGF